MPQSTRTLYVTDFMMELSGLSLRMFSRAVRAVAVSAIGMAMLAALPAPGLLAQGGELPKALDYASARLLRPC